ncbi:MAG: hypothetical protein B6U69_04040 [Thermofilum sp. ex4484_15]|nr:MAG: hypothetical protein B6U69_04040 [Thermofilum sp. ex4484_15]
MPYLSVNDYFYKYLNVLKLIGLGKWEAKVYLTLVRQGPLKAMELARRSSVPPSRIYSVLKKLEEEGWVIAERNSRPATFKAKPPLEVWKEVSVKVRELLNLSDFLRSLQEAYEISHRSAPLKEPVSLIYGIRNVRYLTLNLIREAKNLVYLACPSAEILNEEILEALSSASKRLGSGNAKLLLSDATDIYSLGKLRGVNIRFRDKLFGFGAVSEKEVVLAVKYSTSILGMYSSSSYFTDIARVYFNYLWKDASIEPFEGRTSDTG